MIQTRFVVWALVGVVTVGGAASIGATAIGGSPAALVPTGSSNADSDYCDYLSSQQTKLNELWGSGDQTGLIASLPILNEAASKAPADIQASWTDFTTAIGSLDKAIRATGHQPSEFSAGKFPEGVTQAQRVAIGAAADTLTQPSTQVAAAKILQQVRDVCHFNLDL